MGTTPSTADLFQDGNNVGHVKNSLEPAMTQITVNETKATKNEQESSDITATTLLTAPQSPIRTSPTTETVRLPETQQDPTPSFELDEPFYPGTQEASILEAQKPERIPAKSQENLVATTTNANKDAESDDESVICLGVKPPPAKPSTTPADRIASSNKQLDPSVTEPMQIPANSTKKWALWTRDGVSVIKGSNLLMKIMIEEFPMFESQPKSHNSKGWNQQYKCSAQCPFAVVVQCEVAATDDDDDSFRLLLSPMSCTCGKMKRDPVIPKPPEKHLGKFESGKSPATKKRDFASVSIHQPSSRKRGKNFDDEFWKDENGISTFVGDDALETALRKCHSHLHRGFRPRQYRTRGDVDTGFTMRLPCSGYIQTKGNCQFQIRLECDYAEPGKLDWAAAKFRFSRSVTPCTCAPGAEDSYIPLSIKDCLRDIDRPQRFDGRPMTDKGQETFPDYASALQVAQLCGDLAKLSAPTVIRKGAVHVGYYVGFECKLCKERNVRIYCDKLDDGSETFRVLCKQLCIHSKFSFDNEQGNINLRGKLTATIVPNDEVPTKVGLEKGQESRNVEKKLNDETNTIRGTGNSQLSGTLQISHISDAAAGTKRTRIRRTDLFHQDRWVDSKGDRSFVGIDSAIKALEECARTQPAYRSLFFDQKRKNVGIFMRAFNKMHRTSTNAGWSQQFRCYWSRNRTGGCPFRIRMKCTYVSEEIVDPNKATYELFLGTAPCSGHLLLSDDERVYVTIDSTKVFDFNKNEFKEHCSARTGILDAEALDQAYSFFARKKDEYCRLVSSPPYDDEAVVILDNKACPVIDKVSDSPNNFDPACSMKLHKSTEQHADATTQLSKLPQTSPAIDTSPADSTPTPTMDACNGVVTAKTRNEIEEGIFSVSPWSNPDGMCVFGNQRIALMELLQTMAREKCFPLLDDARPRQQDDGIEIRCICSRVVPCPFAVRIKKLELSESMIAGLKCQIFLTTSECLSKTASHPVSNDRHTQLRKLWTETSPKESSHGGSNVRDVHDVSDIYHTEENLIRKEKINIVVESDEVIAPKSTLSLLAPPPIHSCTMLCLGSQASSKRIEASYDSTQLSFKAGKFVPTSCHGNSKPWYCDFTQDGDMAYSRLHRKCKSSPDQSPTKEDGSTDVSSFAGPMDRNLYLSHLDRMNIGSKQYQSHELFGGTDGCLGRDNATPPPTLLSVAHKESDPEQMVLNEHRKRPATFKQQQHGVVWKERSDKENTMITLSETKDFAAASRQLHCSVGDLLVEYYRWKGNAENQHLYLAAKKRRLSESDECSACGQCGKLIVCETCGKAFHLGCLDPPLKSVPDDQWFCPVCIRRNSSRKCPSIIVSPNRKQYSRQQMALDLESKRRLSMDPQTQQPNSSKQIVLKKPEEEIRMVSNDCQASTLTSGCKMIDHSDELITFAIKPRGMIWNKTRKVWLAPSLTPDESASSSVSDSDDESLSGVVEREIISVSSSQDESFSSEEKQKTHQTLLSSCGGSSSSEEDDDEEFQVADLSDPESESEINNAENTFGLSGPAKANTTERCASLSIPAHLIGNTQQNAQAVSTSALSAIAPRQEYQQSSSLTEPRKATTTQPCTPWSVPALQHGNVAPKTQSNGPAIHTVKNSSPSFVAPGQSNVDMLVYMSYLPITKWGLLIKVAELKNSTGACFNGYRRTPMGGIGPSERQQAFRRKGDRILAVDGQQCRNLPFGKILELLKRRVPGQLRKTIVMETLKGT